MNKPVMPELPEPTTAEGWYSERDVVEHGEAVEAAWSSYAAALEARLREVEAAVHLARTFIKGSDLEHALVNWQTDETLGQRLTATLEQSNG